VGRSTFAHRATVDRSAFVLRATADSLRVSAGLPAEARLRIEAGLPSRSPPSHRTRNKLACQAV